MSTLTLKVQKRSARGSRQVGKIRREGLVPMVLYGKALAEAMPLQVSGSDLLKALHGHATMYSLEEEGGAHTAILKDIQQDPLSGEILHVDFEQVSLTDTVEVTVHVVLKGTPKGAVNGGVLEHQLHELEIECRPDQIPEQITVRVENMEIDDSIYVRDLSVPEGVTVLTDEDQPVVSVHPPRREEEPTPAEEAAEEAQPEVIGQKEREERAKEKEGKQPQEKPEKKEEE